MNKASDLLVIDRDEALLLYKAWGEWWIPKIKTEGKQRVMEYDRINRELKNFIEESHE